MALPSYFPSSGNNPSSWKLYVTWYTNFADVFKLRNLKWGVILDYWVPQCLYRREADRLEPGRDDGRMEAELHF